MERVDEVKRDLRRLRKINHWIDASIAMKERHEKRLEYLRSRKPSEDVQREIEGCEKIVASINIGTKIRESNELESKYLGLIERLDDELDRKIILDCYINGKAYWKTGRDIGFTERGIEQRLKSIIEKIARMIDKPP